VKERISAGAKHPAHAYNEWVWLRGVKLFLDGGMLTGSAWMREPWGVSQIYSIDDPAYRGTPILMLTTESDDAKKAEGRSAGATGWLVKPFNPEKLVATVRKVCP
jgi:DNA-binding NtrC family response regulator